MFECARQTTDDAGARCGRRRRAMDAPTRDDDHGRANRAFEATTALTTTMGDEDEGAHRPRGDDGCRAPDDETLLRELYTRWPGRRRPIEALVNALGDARDDHPPMYVHGPPVTGKTSIVRDVLRASGRAHAYASCATEHSPKLLYEAVVEELSEVLNIIIGLLAGGAAAIMQ